MCHSISSYMCETVISFICMIITIHYNVCKILQNMVDTKTLAIIVFKLIVLLIKIAAHAKLILEKQGVTKLNSKQTILYVVLLKKI